MSVSADALRTHIDYTVWASLRLLDAAAKLPAEDLTHDFQTADHTILDTLVHIFAADRVWLSRVAGQPVGPFVTEADRSLAALQIAWPPLLDAWKSWAAKLDDAQAVAGAAYLDLKGNPNRQPLWQLLLHVVNHGTHHRGQVVGFLRALGHTPPVVDLIHFYRSTQREK